MTTTKKIMKALHISYLLYDNFREHSFHRWCSKYCNEFGLSLHEMSRHDGLRNWYLDQWQVLVEKPFAKQYGDYFDCPEYEPEEVETLMDILFEYPAVIQENYPITLLKMIQDEQKFIRRRSSLQQSSL